MFFALLFSVVFACVTVDAASAMKKVKQTINPFVLYGKEIHFDVYREGKKVGTHQVTFSGTLDDLKVESLFTLKIKILFIEAYYYEYQSLSRWINGVLTSLKASVDDDGEKSFVEASRKGNKIIVKNSQNTFSSSIPLFPTNHWHPGVLNQEFVLNTLTGSLNAVKIIAKGREDILTERGSILATRYAYTGDLDTEIWYDDAGHWVGMQFKGTDGTLIKYVCRACLGA